MQPKPKVSRLKDLVLVAVLLLVTAIAIHFWVADRLKLKQMVFPVQAAVAHAKWRCTPDAPGWMPDLLLKAGRASGSLSNQLAHIDPDGNLYHCENGWQREFFASPAVDQNTRFRIASITKVFTADAVLSLIRSGRLRLDTLLIDIFPEVLPLRDESIKLVTIEMLLNHSAGFDRHKTTDPLFEIKKKPWCPENIKRLSAIYLDFEPGEKQVYSNVGYCILGAVVERVAGQSFREFIESRYNLQSYGLKFIDGPFLKDEVRYDFRHNSFFGEDYYKLFDFYSLSSSAGLSGNAVGLARLIKDISAEKTFGIMGSKGLKKCVKSELRSCYGYAFYNYKAINSDLVAYIHEGLLPGASSVVLVDSYGGVTVLLTGGEPPGGDREAESLYKYIYEVLGGWYVYQNF